MIKNSHFLLLHIFILFFFLFPCAVSAGAYSIKGSIGINVEDGKFIPGQLVTVFLVAEAIEPPEIPDLNGLDRFEKIDRLNECIKSNFLIFWKKSLDNRYFVDRTVSNDRGDFEFRDVKQGNYYVLVSFPTIIGGYKVSWQVPVEVNSSNNDSVTLGSNNLLFPAYSRYRILRK